MLKNMRPGDFILAVGGQAISNFGDEVAVVALTLRLQAHHGRPYEIAFLLAAGLVPVIVLGRWAGRLADSLDSRRLIVAASGAQALCCFGLVFAEQTATVVVLVGLLGIGTAIAKPTWQALVPRIVGEAQIGRAVAIQQGVSTIAMTAAPAVGGLLSGAFGTGLPLVVDTVTFVAMAAAALVIRTRRHGTLTSAATSSRGAWSYIRSDPTLTAVTAGLTSFVLITMMVSVVEVFLVRTTLHASSTWYGAIMALWVGGMIAGTARAGRVKTDDARLAMTTIGAVTISVALCGYAATPNVAVMLPISLLGGAGNGALNSGAGALIMTHTTEHFRGRVSAAVTAVTSAASLLSLALGGLLGIVFDPRTVFLLAGTVGIFAAAVIALCWRAWNHREMMDDRRPGSTVLDHG